MSLSPEVLGDYYLPHTIWGIHLPTARWAPPQARTAPGRPTKLHMHANRAVLLFPWLTGGTTAGSVCCPCPVVDLLYCFPVPFEGTLSCPIAFHIWGSAGC